MNLYWSAGICLFRHKESTHASSNKATLVFYGICTVQARPSTVVSLKDWPTVKETFVVRTLVEVLMDRSSPCWVISTTGLEAAATAIFLKKTFTPDPPAPAQTELLVAQVKRDLKAKTTDPCPGYWLHHFSQFPAAYNTCIISSLYLSFRLQVLQAKKVLDCVPGFQKPLQPVQEFPFFSTSLWWFWALNSTQLFQITFCNSLSSLGFL